MAARGSPLLLCAAPVSHALLGALLGVYYIVPVLTGALLWLYTVACEGTMPQRLGVSVVGLTVLLGRYVVHQIGSAGRNSTSIGVGVLLLTIGNPVGQVAAVLLAYWMIALVTLLALLHLSFTYLLKICDSLFKWVTGTARFRRRGVVMLFQTVIPTVMDVLNRVEPRIVYIYLRLYIYLYV